MGLADLFKFLFGEGFGHLAPGDAANARLFGSCVNFAQLALRRPGG